MEEKLTTLFQTIDEVTLRLSEEPEIAASIRESGNRGRSAVYAKLYEETASLREMAQFDLYSEASASTLPAQACFIPSFRFTGES